MTQSSAMSITQLVHSEDDADVQMAAQVLGDMARLSNVKKKVITLPPLSTPSTTPSSPLPTPTTSFKQRLSFSSDSTIEEEPRPKRQVQQQNFMYRVSNIPLVNSAIKVYENSKNANSVMKYSAEKVESFVGPILSSVDEWGCKQLDKLQERYPNYVSTKVENDEDDDCKSTTFALSRATLLDDTTEGIRKRRDSRDDYSLKNKSRNTCTSPHRPYSITKPTPNRHHRQPPLERSKWHQIVMHASSAAGTTAAVISEESMKCLKYCLNWLHYASQHIDHQMNLLRKFLVSLASSNTHDTSTLNHIKKEIVNTLRKLVEVISKYAGQGLPEQAKTTVRGFILALPSRWAILHSSTNASPMNSPSLNPTNHIQDTSIKLLNFGNESMEMIHSVAHVFSHTIERAELWLSRIGVSRSIIDQEQMDLN